MAKSGADKEAEYSVKVAANVAEILTGADSVEKLSAAIDELDARHKALSAAQRRLKGTTSEVKEAREQLRTEDEVSKRVISALTLEMLKQGATREALARKEKQAADAKKKIEAEKKKSDEELRKSTNSVSSALSLAGGPVSGLASKIGSLNGVVGEGGTALGAMAFGVASGVAAIVALEAAVASAVVRFTSFVLEGANAARTMNLVREAATGSAVNARNLGTHVDELARKLPTPKEKLNELAVALAKTRLSGKAIVDTFNLTAQASEAMGDSVGSRLKEIVERGQLTRRMFLSPQELFGTGLHFDDVAQQLATGTKTSLVKAREALFTGRVPLEVGAEALRKAVEKRFGQVNLAKSLDLTVLKTKFLESMQALTKGVNLDGLLESLSKLMKMISPETATGAALKKIVEVLGNGMVNAIDKSLPIVRRAFQGMTIGALTLVIAALKARNTIRDTFGGTFDMGGLVSAEDVITTAKVATYALAGGLAVFAVAAGTAAAAAYALAKPFIGVASAVVKAKNAVAGFFGAKEGKSAVDGLKEGMTLGLPGISETAKLLASKLKSSFRNEMQIRSPSRAMAEDGRHVTAGLEQGIAQGTPAVVEGMRGVTKGLLEAPSSSGARAGSAGGARAPIALGPVTVNIDARGATKEAVDGLRSKSFHAELMKALEDALQSAGGVPA